MMWKETSVTHMNLKSFIARVTKTGSQYKVLGVVLNDGTPIKSVEVKVDDGPWQMATLDPSTKREVRLEAVHLRLDRRDAWRSHPHLARDGRQRQGAEDGAGKRNQEVVPRGGFTGAAEGEGGVARHAQRP